MDNNLTIQERFIKFCHIENSQSERLFTVLQSFLDELGLYMQSMRSQAYDGAANMSGRISGLQARVKEVNPMACYVHCTDHRLNLALAAFCSHVTEAVTFLEIWRKYTHFQLQVILDL